MKTFSGITSVAFVLLLNLPCVILQAPVSITTNSSTATAVIGQSLLLTCEATGAGPITWRWNYTGKCEENLNKCIYAVQLSDGSTKFVFKRNMENGSLYFSLTRLEDSGEYCCVASNSGGRDSHCITLTVKKIVRVDGELQQHTDKFDPQLLNRNSTQYKYLEKEIKKIMDSQFKYSKSWYQETQILGFRNLSDNLILINFRVLADISNTTPEEVAEDVASHMESLIPTSQLFNIIPGSFKLKVRPLPPQDLNHEDIKETLVFISWKLPKFHEFFNIQNYSIHYKKSSQDNWLVAVSGLKFSKVVSTYRLENLDDSTQYDVRMFAFNQYGISNPSSVLTVETRQKTDILLIVAVIVGSVVLMIVLVIIAICVIRRRKPRNVARMRHNENSDEASDNRQNVKSNFYAASYKKYLEDRDIEMPGWENDALAWEIPEDKLKLGEIIGSGEFGIVVKGLLNTGAKVIDCAVKMLKEHGTEQEFRDLLNELNLMISITKHPNLVNLIGARTADNDLMIVVEYCANGNLLTYLQSHHTGQNYINIQNETSTLTFVQKLQISWDISKGMEHLEKLKCVHRDLAARNVLLTDSLQAKVSDFGMSRDVYEKGFYEKTTSGKLPVKWMAIESLQSMQFTSKSDVWSFGVVLWEIETGGLVPYPGIQGKHMLQELMDDYRMDKPPACQEILYEIMLKCWQAQPDNRPNFQQLREELELLLSNETGYLPMEPASFSDSNESINLNVVT